MFCPELRKLNELLIHDLFLSHELSKQRFSATLRVCEEEEGAASAVLLIHKDLAGIQKS